MPQLLENNFGGRWTGQKLSWQLDLRLTRDYLLDFGNLRDTKNTVDLMYVMVVLARLVSC